MIFRCSSLAPKSIGRSYIEEKNTFELTNNHSIVYKWMEAMREIERKWDEERKSYTDLELEHNSIKWIRIF